MIKLNTAHILPDEPYELRGEEDSAFLELESSERLPMTPDKTVRYDLSASLAGNDLLVKGFAEFGLDTVCARCDAPIRRTIRADEICIYRENARDQEVDLTEDVREELLLALPTYFHCSEDCKGICPRCGADLNKEACRCKLENDEIRDDDGDSPWKALDGLKLK